MNESSLSQGAISGISGARNQAARGHDCLKFVGPGVTSPKSRSLRVQSRPRRLWSRSRLSSGPLILGVEDELAVDGVGDLSLERPDGFPLGLAFGHLSLEVGPALRLGLTDLADGHHVDGVVELTVPSPGQSVDDPATRGELDGGGAVVGGELVPVVNRRMSPV